MLTSWKQSGPHSEEAGIWYHQQLFGSKANLLVLLLKESTPNQLSPWLQREQCATLAQTSICSGSGAEWQHMATCISLLQNIKRQKKCFSTKKKCLNGYHLIIWTERISFSDLTMASVRRRSSSEDGGSVICLLLDRAGFTQTIFRKKRLALLFFISS